MKTAVIALLKELIKNKCVNDGKSGSESSSAHTLSRFFASYGIKAQLLEAYPGRANLLVRIKGEQPHAPSLMYMGHMDVVPACPEAWTCDPFSGLEQNNAVWGRGAIDMLNITATSAVAFAELYKKEKCQKGDFIYLATADEEASSRYGVRWLVENHWDKVKADYIITEPGGFFVHGGKGSRVCLVYGEKGLGTTTLSVRGTAGHGSLPYKADNAGLKCAHAARRIGRYAPQVCFSNELKLFIKNLPLSSIKKFLLSHPVFFRAMLAVIYKKTPGLAKHLDAVSRMTLCPTLLSAGVKLNIIPDNACLHCDNRILHHHTVEDVVREFSRALGPLSPDFSLEIEDFFPATVSGLNTPLYNAIAEITGLMYPDVQLLPTIFSGVTDARFFRIRGSVAYGFSLFDRETTLDDYLSLLHGANERVSIKSLEQTCAFFYRLPESLYRMLGL